MFARDIALLFLLFAASAEASLTVNPIDLGEQRPGKVITANLVISNESDKPVDIVQQSSGNLHLTKLPLTIAAHASTDLSVAVTVGRELGAQTYSVDLDLNNEQKTLRVRANVFVDSAIDDEPKVANFGIVKAGQRAEDTVVFTSRDLPEIRAEKVVDEDKLVAPQIEDGGKRIVLQTREDVAWGLHEGWIEVETNSSLQPKAWIKYKFETRGRIVPETYLLDAGLQRVEHVQAQSLFIRDEQGGLLRLGKISQVGSPLHVRETDCPVKVQSCRMIEVKVDDKKKSTGRLSSVIDIELPQYKQSLKVEFVGILLSPDTHVTDLNLEGTKQSVSASTRNVGAAIENAVSHPKAALSAPTPAGKGPLLKWSVENERQIYGYLIYRADQEDGPLRRINDTIIRTLSQDDGEGVEYKWRDTTAEPGRTYWYQIGTIDKRDMRKDLTGRVSKSYTQEATAK